MWVVLKFDRKRLNFLKEDFNRKLGKTAFSMIQKCLYKNLREINYLKLNLMF